VSADLPGRRHSAKADGDRSCAATDTGQYARTFELCLQAQLQVVVQAVQMSVRLRPAPGDNCFATVDHGKDFVRQSEHTAKQVHHALVKMIQVRCSSLSHQCFQQHVGGASQQQQEDFTHAAAQPIVQGRPQPAFCCECVLPVRCPKYPPLFSKLIWVCRCCEAAKIWIAGSSSGACPKVLSLRNVCLDGSVSYGSCLQATLLSLPDGYLCREQEAVMKYLLAFREPARAAEWCLMMQVGYCKCSAVPDCAALATVDPSKTQAFTKEDGCECVSLPVTLHNVVM